MANKRGGGRKTRGQEQRTYSPDKKDKAPAVVSSPVTQYGKDAEGRPKSDQDQPGNKNPNGGRWETRLSRSPWVKLAGFLIGSCLMWLAVEGQWEETEVSRQSIALSNRPKFTLAPTTSRPPLVAGRPVRFEFVLKNIGGSPAFVEPCPVHVVDRPPGELFVAPTCPEAHRKRLGSAAQHVPVESNEPNNIVTIPFVVTLSEGELRQIRERKAALFFYADMPYRDFAKNTYPLSFCFFVTGEDNGGFSPCPKGNVNE